MRSAEPLIKAYHPTFFRNLTDVERVRLIQPRWLLTDRRELAEKWLAFRKVRSIGNVPTILVGPKPRMMLEKPQVVWDTPGLWYTLDGTLPVLERYVLSDQDVFLTDVEARMLGEKGGT